MFFPSSFSLLCYPVHLPKVKRNLRSSQLTKMKEVKECEKGCVQAEGKPPKFQSSLIMLHLVWESCTSKERMNGRRIKAQIWLFQDSWCALDEKPPVFREDFLEGEDKPFSIAECFVCEVLAVQPCRPTSVPPLLALKHFYFSPWGQLRISPVDFIHQLILQRSSRGPIDYLPFQRVGA